jgi:hypothetical protein
MWECVKHLRYADDIAVFTGSQKVAEWVLKSYKRYLERKLKLKVNLDKNEMGSPLKLKFLGFCLFKTGKGVGIQMHDKPLKKLKAKLKAIDKRNRVRSMGTFSMNSACIFRDGYIKLYDY